MDGIKVGLMGVALAGVSVGGIGGSGGKIDVVADMGDGMQCNDHPYRNNPGGICAFCLQEKLGKLVSSSFPLPIRPSSASSSTSPSFRSDFAVSGGGDATTGGGASNHQNRFVGLGGGSASNHHSRVVSGGDSGDGGGFSLFSVRPRRDNGSNGNGNSHGYYTRRSRISFMLAKKKKIISSSSTSSSDQTADIVLKRSKSTTTPRSTTNNPRHHRFLDDSNDDFTPIKRGFFWSFNSFLYHSSKPTKNLENNNKSIIEEDDNPSPPPGSGSSFDRKVSRSRSVGCGSRSFSGDFFDRISTGFGDCTLRRVESQRESKPPSSGASMKKCGGIFGGFIINSSNSNSSSSSSSYWVSSEENNNNKSTAHGRSKSWGWAFASPMRAFGGGSNTGKIGKRVIISNKNNSTTPNLAAIPSLLAVRT